MSSIAPLPPTSIARTLAEATNACDVDKPLAGGDLRYQDFSAARGDEAVTVIWRRLATKPRGTWRHLVFASHRGSGKSTELLRIADQLKNQYRRLYLEANLDLDPTRIESEDFLLVLAQSVESQLRSWNLALPDELLESVATWFREVVETTSWGKSYSAEIAAGASVNVPLSLFAKLTASIKGLLRTESEHRKEVRSVLRKYPRTLLDTVNSLLDAANTRLAEVNEELLVIVDNLDRYKPEYVEDLLVLGADSIRELRCNLIVTPPISLIYRPQAGLVDELFESHVMYAIRLRRPDQGYAEFDGPGRALVVDALKRRIELDTLIPDEATRDRLIAASGGSIREVLDLVSMATLFAAGDRVTLADAERAVVRRRQTIRDLVNANGWIGPLVRLARDKQISNDQGCLDVLFHRLAFKYNGDGWYDIHPLVSELPEFVRAYQQPPGPFPPSP